MVLHPLNALTVRRRRAGLIVSSMAMAILVVPAGYSAGSTAPPSISTLQSLASVRLADTRAGAHTVDGLSAGMGAVGAGKSLDVVVTGRGGVPASGVGAVVLNL